MNCKIAFSLLVICLAQSLISARHNNPHNVRDVLEDLQKEMKEVMKLGKREVERSVDLIENDGARWKENSRRMIRDAIEDLEKILHVAGKCGDLQQPKLETIKVEAETAVQQCATGEISQVKNVIENLQGNVSFAERILIQMDLGEQQCDILEQATLITCLNKVIHDEEPLIEKSILTMIPLIDEAILFQAEIATCVDSAEINLQVSIQQIILDVQKCLIQ